MRNVVLVGIGEVVEQVPDDLTQVSSPADMMQRAAQEALKDAGGKTGAKNIASIIDTIAVVRTNSDSGAQLKSPFGDPDNYPQVIGGRLGITPKSAVYSAAGGQAPQHLVNEFSSKIAKGLCDAVLLVGGEAIANQKAMKRAKVKADWTEEISVEPSTSFDNRPSDITKAIDIAQLQNEFTHIPSLYTMLDNARRSRLGLSIEDYRKDCADLFERFANVAAGHAGSMFSQSLSANEIQTLTDTNNAVTDLYSRAMTAKDGVNQGAALILMSEDIAKELSIDSDKWVYPVSGASALEKTILYREDLGRSVAMMAAYEAAFEFADLSVSDITHMDIYSCFPIAVFAACEALGIKLDDPRGLTTTGGLPFFGGPGNNYAMHGIVNVARKLRQDGHGYGLVGANGGFLSKHCVGLYGASAPELGWRNSDEDALSPRVNVQATPGVITHADGRARIEGYSVEFGKNGPVRGYVIGRLENGQRFMGVTDRGDKETVSELLNRDPLARTIYVTSKGPGNRFTFDPAKTYSLIPKAPMALDGAFEYIKVSRDGHVLEVTINRPDARNSLTPDANFELERVFDLYENDQSLWAAIITGAGEKAFSSGNDLKYMGTGKPIWIPETGFAGLTHRKSRLKPVIAAVNGYAFGGGLEIALACDIIVADESAKFALPEVKTGLIAAAGGLFRLPKILPPHIAREMILTGRTMEVDEALHYGMVNHKTKTGKAMIKARELAQTICGVSPTATSASLEMMNEGAHILDPTEALDQPTNAMLKVAISEDLQIGLMAFLTKQKAKWKNR